MYNFLLNNYEVALKYFVKNSDSFSLISNLKKPYSKVPPNYAHMDKEKELLPYLVNQLRGITEWPGTETRGATHKILNEYKSCKQTYAILQKMPNIFLPLEHNMSEDICFYKKGKPWFVTVSHEELAFFEEETKEDIQFLVDNGFPYMDDE